MKESSPQFNLLLIVHAHQPAGNFEHVFEECYQLAYDAFLSMIEKHPRVRMGLHYSGPLLLWLEKKHPDYFERLRNLVAAGQIELIGGGFYEPILVSIPLADQVEQITRLANYIEQRFGKRPGGAWLAERVWEPQLPSSLAPAGVKYTLVDDNHFLGAGFELSQLFGHYRAEDQCCAVDILPGLKTLRYLLPFRPVGETVDFLRHAASEHVGRFATMGDDLEKFGVWPGTNKLCYTDGWLENLFCEFEKNADWLETSTPGDAVASHPSFGRADLPTASYTEMMEWALPTPARVRFHALTEEFASRPESLPFVRGGIWRNFFTKYRESNLLQKKVVHVSGKLQKLAEKNSRDKAFVRATEAAAELLLRSQCNDAYWHGVFGGLYAPHLRTALWNSLIEAESIADRLSHRTKQYADVAQFDFDSDGRDEIYFTSERYAALLRPDDGATICAIDCRETNVALINSLERRLEAYHAKLKNLGSKNFEHAKSIHEQMRVKEEGLERWLHYDRWPRHTFRLLLFSPTKTYQDCATVSLEENAALAGGRFRVVDVSKTGAKLASEESADWPAEKTFTFARTPNGFEIGCDVSVRRTAPGNASVVIGIEAVVNFLAPSAPDRYFESSGERYPLRWASAVPASSLRTVDEWQKTEVEFKAPAARDFWISPIETVSESEDGFERIYQGSQIIAVWPAELQSGAEWRGNLTLAVSSLGR